MDYICIPLIETKGVMDLSKLTNGNMDIHLYIHEHRGATGGGSGGARLLLHFILSYIS